MIECRKFKSFSKGSLQGFADLYFPKWGIEIKSCTLHMKEGKRWVNFPSKEFENENKEKVYMSLIRFENKDFYHEFSRQAKVAIDKFCQENV